MPARHGVDAGELCRRAGLAIASEDWPLATSLCERAIALGVVDADVFNNLATLYDRQGVKADAICDLLGKAHALAPAKPHIKKNYLVLLARQIESLVNKGRLRDALPLLKDKAALEPNLAQSQRAAGRCLAQLGDLQAALPYFVRAIDLEPNEASHYNDFGLVCYELGLLAEARGAFQQVLNLKPDAVEAYVHLGVLANFIGQPAIAINMLQRALHHDPACAEAHSNLAIFLRDQGRQQESRQHYLRAMELRPDSTAIFSNYLLLLNDLPGVEPAWIASEHKRFASLIPGPSRPIVVRDRNPSRRLRVGYLSPDFRQHSVAYFILPVMAAHDRVKVEVTGYFTSQRNDEMTAAIKSACDRWRDAYRMSDEELGALIMNDEIDVLIELSGHSSNNRMAMLAGRVAPVQMTYLGYPNTTGLTTMDYRLTDAIADPPGKTEALHTERLLRMEGGFLAYRPPAEARELPVSPPPAQCAGHVTFGSFNNLAKINEAVIESWAAILDGVPESVLLLKANGLKDERAQARLREAFAARGVAADRRVVMLGDARSTLDHLSLYARMDLALDTFPYNGTTTTCEALWMGTPVLTLAGQSHACRVGASLLTHIGLEDLICETRETYVERAVALGRDQEQLKTLRSGLRERFQSSSVMDASRLARELESAFAQSWRAFCEAAS